MNETLDNETQTLLREEKIITDNEEKWIKKLFLCCIAGGLNF